MTRCYRTYCTLINSEDAGDILECMGIGDRQQDRVWEYITFMRNHGVKFDRSEEDEVFFDDLMIKHGSEAAVTQPITSKEGTETTVLVTEQSTSTPVTCIERINEDAEIRTTHVSHATGVSEWYTPEEYITAARVVMGSIDVDPASSEIANRTVRAERYYTKEEDGLKQSWNGNVWLNPPYSQPVVSNFCNLLVEKYRQKEVKQACVFLNNATDTIFIQNLFRYCQAICLVKGRVAFLDPEGRPGSPLQGQIVIYFGSYTDLFANVFKKFGVVFIAG